MGTELTRHKNGSMTFKKSDSVKGSDPVKKKPRRKPVYIHKCSERVQLERMRVILVGNGDVKTGLAFKMEKSIDDIKEIKNNITEIKNKLEETITAASTAASSLEKYKLEVKSFENGKSDTEEKLKIADDLKKKNEKEEIEKKERDRREKWQRVFWIIMAVIGLIAIGVNIYFNIVGNEKQDTTIQKVDNLGIPIIVDSTGTVINTRASIKMWGKDFDTDTIKINKE